MPLHTSLMWGKTVVSFMLKIALKTKVARPLVNGDITFNIQQPEWKKQNYKTWCTAHFIFTGFYVYSYFQLVTNSKYYPFIII